MPDSRPCGGVGSRWSDVRQGGWYAVHVPDARGRAWCRSQVSLGRGQSSRMPPATPSRLASVRADGPWAGDGRCRPHNGRGRGDRCRFLAIVGVLPRWPATSRRRLTRALPDAAVSPGSAARRQREPRPAPWRARCGSPLAVRLPAHHVRGGRHLTAARRDRTTPVHLVGQRPVARRALLPQHPDRLDDVGVLDRDRVPDPGLADELEDQRRPLCAARAGVAASWPEGAVRIGH